jgi:pimeloyl-ACP methyl ester carboxylesterase
MAGSSATWMRVMPALARRFTVIAPDLLGHGASAKGLGEYSVSGHANMLTDLLTAIGHERATLVGQSFGGGVAMQMAYQSPKCCERLVLVSSGGLGKEVSILLRALSLPGSEHVVRWFCSPAIRNAGTRVAAWLGRAGIEAAPGVTEIWRAYAALADRDARLAFFRTLRGVIDPSGQTVSAADRLYLASHVPTLIIWGARDSLIPVSHGVAAQRAIPGSRLEIYDDVGHFPHCEAAAKFIDAVVDFVATTAPAQILERHRRELLLRHAG